MENNSTEMEPMHVWRLVDVQQTKSPFRASVLTVSKLLLRLNEFNSLSELFAVFLEGDLSLYFSLVLTRKNRLAGLLIPEHYEFIL